MFWIAIAVVVMLICIGPLFLPRTTAGSLPEGREFADELSHFVGIHGLAIHYKDFPASGTGSDADVTSFLLLHGFGSSIATFRHIVPALRSFGRVIMFDRPGFGLSSRPTGWTLTSFNPYRREAQRQMTIEIMDLLGVQKAVIVGHSSGCQLAVEIAHQNPSRIVGLALVSPSLYRSPSIPMPLRLLLRFPPLSRIGTAITRSAFTKWTTATDETADTPLLKNSWYDPTRADVVTRDEISRLVSIRNWDRSLWAMALSDTRTEAARHLRELSMPVLVIAGDSDRVAPMKDHERLVEELPGSRLVVVAHAGHSPHEEQPEETSRTLKAFLREKLDEHFPT